MNTQKTYQELFVPKHINFIKDISELSIDLPDNIYLDKTITGCGLTTCIMQNNVNYVIAVPFKSLAKNKLIQAKKNPEFFPHEIIILSGDTNDFAKEIGNYLIRNENKIKKIIITYDSLPKLKNFINFKEYKILIDECHKLLEYAGNFKPKVVNDVMELMTEFKAYVAGTATPTRETYIPVQLQNSDKIKLVWEDSEPVSINHQRLNANQLREYIISIAVNHKRNPETGNAYIFYNSVSGIVKHCKDLIKFYGFTSDDIKIICAQSDVNVKTVSSLGKTFKIKEVIDETDKKEYYPINFITSTAFEGQDFLDPDGRTYIVSDSKLEHTKLDISTQVSQIVGRLRDSKYKNEINLLWTASPTLGFINNEAYQQKLENDLKAAEKYMTVFDFATNEEAKTAQISLINGVEKDPFFIDMTENEEPDLIINPNAINHLMNVFEGTKLQYFVSHCNHLKDNIGNVDKKVDISLNQIFTGEIKSTLEIPELSAADKLKIKRKTDRVKILREYTEALDTIANAKYYLTDKKELEETKNFVSDIESDASYELLVEFVKTCKVSMTDIANYSNSYLRDSTLEKKIDEEKARQILSKEIKNIFSIGQSYSLNYINSELLRLKTAYQLNIKLKTTLLENIYKIKKTTKYENGKSTNAVYIESLK
jgi:hypothetical protein